MKLFNITLDLDGTVANTYKGEWMERNAKFRLRNTFALAEPITNRIKILTLLSKICNIEVCTWLPPTAIENEKIHK